MPRGPKEQPWIKWSPEKLARVKSLRLKGYTIPEIAEIMDETRNTINGAMQRKIGYPTRRDLAKSAWQPIETAPKDGTIIIAHESGITDVVRYSDIQKSFVRWDDEARKPWRYEPSHWMPLPEPPK